MGKKEIIFQIIVYSRIIKIKYLGKKSILKTTKLCRKKLKRYTIFMELWKTQYYEDVDSPKIDPMIFSSPSKSQQAFREIDKLVLRFTWKYK